MTVFAALLSALLARISTGPILGKSYDAVDINICQWWLNAG